MFDSFKRDMRDNKQANLIQEADRLFQVRRIGNTDFLFYEGVRISTEQDANDPKELLQRLADLKDAFVQSRMTD